MLLNFYILLWLISFVGLFYSNNYKNKDHQINNAFCLTLALVLTLIWYTSPISYLDLNLDGMMTGSNGFVNLLGYI